MSRWMNGGQPHQCAFGPCSKQFNGHAWRGYDDKYYCTEFCSDEAEDNANTEQRARRAS